MNVLFDLFRSRFPSDLDSPFIETMEGKSITYRALLDITGRLANVLSACGIGPGDRVAIQAPKSPEALLFYLATLRAGAVHLPLNPAYTTAELRYFLSDSEATLFVCSPDQAVDLENLAADAGVRRLETLGLNGEGTLFNLAQQAPAFFADVERGPDDLAAILYTSGTTGRPKGAMLTHGNLASNGETLREIWGISSEDRLLHALPIFHVHGLFVAANVALLSGASLLFLSSFKIDDVMKALPRATVMMGVPTFYVRLLERPEFDFDLVKHMRLFISGSAPLSVETHREFEKRTGHLILERYGMTETIIISSNPVNGLRVAGSVGFPLPRVGVRISEALSERSLPPLEIGRIEVCGPNLFKGYWRKPEKTAEDFTSDGFFITGDLGYLDPEGRLFIVGRAKDVIISGGYNVYPAEVEAALDLVPGVAESAVIGVPHADLGEGVVAVIVPHPEAELEEETVRSALKPLLAGFKHPKRYYFLEALPRNAMGKVLRPLLRKRFDRCFEAW